jgi:hypothetical protein
MLRRFQAGQWAIIIGTYLQRLPTLFVDSRIAVFRTPLRLKLPRIINNFSVLLARNNIIDALCAQLQFHMPVSVNSNGFFILL